MIQLIKSISFRMQKRYYYHGHRGLSLTAIVIFLIWFLYNYGTAIRKCLYTEKGLLLNALFIATLVLSLTIKMYYRVIVIKYQEKDTRIKLFENAFVKNRCPVLDKTQQKLKLSLPTILCHGKNNAHYT